MNNDFYNKLLSRQQKVEAVASNQEIAFWATRLIGLLFPEYARQGLQTVEQIAEGFNVLEGELINIISKTLPCKNCDAHSVAQRFFTQIPEMYRILNTDIQAILEGDPAAKSEFEIIRAYPGFFAICFYRIAHMLHTLEINVLPRILTEWAHSKTGIDIHPGAEIGEYLYIDHGTGIVIGESTRIGNYVKLYQGVTLGALSVDKSMAFTKRHPTVEDHVVIYSGATILGGETTIGAHSIIGGNVWLTRSVPPGSSVYHKPEITVVQRKLSVEN